MVKTTIHLRAILYVLEDRVVFFDQIQNQISVRSPVGRTPHYTQLRWLHRKGLVKSEEAYTVLVEQKGIRDSYVRYRWTITQDGKDILEQWRDRDLKQYPWMSQLSEPIADDTHLKQYEP